jgi:hypothetical protein
MPKPKYPHARLSPAKDELLVIAITRDSVMTGNIRPLLDQLVPLAGSRDAAIAWEGKITFYFDGWDRDPRETAEIPEIRSYFLDVTAEFPYWFHFVEKVGDTFWHVLRLLCRGHMERVRPGLIAWRFDDPGGLVRQVQLLLDYMNQLYDRLELPETMNERISQEVAQLIECSLQ